MKISYIYLPWEKNTVTKISGKWMDWECIILSKVTQYQKNKNYMLSHEVDSKLINVTCEKERKEG